MLPRTQAAVDRLKSIVWFHNVGIRDTQSADVLGSWKDAVAWCTGDAWGDLCQEAVDRYADRLAEVAPADFARWKDVSEDVQPAAEALVRSKTQQMVLLHDLPRSFVRTCEWDILHLLIESEFADAYPPGFYAAQAYWYTKGHFPCGYIGKFPDGRRVIY